MKIVMTMISVVLVGSPSFANVAELKQQIFSMAESFTGQGDPDGSKQQKLEVLVNQLLVENPQGPVTERLPLIYGAWKQIWGPYEYRKNNRGVDPRLDPQNIYQVVFEGGYYYNVNPTLNKEGKRTKITLLRGEFELGYQSENNLAVRFTDLRKVKKMPAADLQLYDLAALSESGTLAGEKTVLPSFLVRLFFGGGNLEEVYTDEDLRITYGSSKDEKLRNYIYILKRASSSHERK